MYLLNSCRQNYSTNILQIQSDQADDPSIDIHAKLDTSDMKQYKAVSNNKEIHGCT